MDASCKIAYGYIVDKAELPWNDETYEGDIDEWWRKSNGYKPPFDLYDDKGNYIVDPTPKEDIDTYYAHRKAWDEAHPCPFGFLHGSEGEEEAMITSAEIDDFYFDWDYGWQEVDPSEFAVNNAQVEAVEAVKVLIEALNIEIKRGPGWYAVCDFS